MLIKHLQIPVAKISVFPTDIVRATFQIFLYLSLWVSRGSQQITAINFARGCVSHQLYHHIMNQTEKCSSGALRAPDVCGFLYLEDNVIWKLPRHQFRHESTIRSHGEIIKPTIFLCSKLRDPKVSENPEGTDKHS